MSGIFFVIGFAFIVGILLIFATSFSGKKKSDGIGELSTQQLPKFDRFVRICRDLTEHMKLEIEREEIHPEDGTLEFYAHSPTPITGASFIIHGVLSDPQQQISAAEIVEMSNLIIQDRRSKGIMITTGRFTDELPAISELAPMEFIDGPKLEELARKYKIPLTNS